MTTTRLEPHKRTMIDRKNGEKVYVLPLQGGGWRVEDTTCLSRLIQLLRNRGAVRKLYREVP